MPSESTASFERLAAGLYGVASMLVGEGEDSARLVETAIFAASAEDARLSSSRALAAAAIRILDQRKPGSLAAPQGLDPVLTCIEDEDLDAAGSYGEELARMIAGPDRDRVREWLESLPTMLRTIFVLRAVAGFSPQETAALLAANGGAQAAGWTADAVREYFRQALCSIASQLLHETAVR